MCTVHTHCFRHMTWDLKKQLGQGFVLSLPSLHPNFKFNFKFKALRAQSVSADFGYTGYTVYTGCAAYSVYVPPDSIYSVDTVFTVDSVFTVYAVYNQRISVTSAPSATSATSAPSATSVASVASVISVASATSVTSVTSAAVGRARHQRISVTSVPPSRTRFATSLIKSKK